MTYLKQFQWDKYWTRQIETKYGCYCASIDPIPALVLFGDSFTHQVLSITLGLKRQVAATATGSKYKKNKIK